MASVTINGHTYTDDANTNTGLAGGGHKLRFIPALQDVVAVAAEVASDAIAAAASAGDSNADASAAAANAADALASKNTAETYAGAIINQVTAGAVAGSVVATSNGSAAAPIFTRATDLNTGIYFPALDQVGMATGGLARVLVDNTGLLTAMYGIKTTSKGIVVDSNEDNSTIGASVHSRVLITNSYASAFGRLAEIVFGLSDTVVGRGAAISSAYTTYHATNGAGFDLRFSTKNAATDTTPMVRMWISGVGNLSVGQPTDDGINKAQIYGTLKASNMGYVASAQSTDATINQYAKIASITISSQYADKRVAIIVLPAGTSVNSPSLPVMAYISVKQQSAFGNNPLVDVTFSYSHQQTLHFELGYVIVQNTPTTVVDIYVKVKSAYTAAHIGLLHATGVSAMTWYYSAAISVTQPANYVAGTVQGQVFSNSNGRVIVGGATENTAGAKLQVVDGITFPATQVASADANTLDDYEEGLFTPVVYGVTTAGVGTYTVQFGKYTKTGNTVTIKLNLAWTAHTGTGAMRISGLPFVSNASGSYNPLSVVFDGLTVAANKMLTPEIPPTATTISLALSDTAGGALTDSTIDTSVNNLSISGAFFV